MRNEFTAIIERDGDWFIAYCPEIPGADIKEAKRCRADFLARINEKKLRELAG